MKYKKKIIEILKKSVSENYSIHMSMKKDFSDPPIIEWMIHYFISDDMSKISQKEASTGFTVLLSANGYQEIYPHVANWHYKKSTKYPDCFDTTGWDVLDVNFINDDIDQFDDATLDGMLEILRTHISSLWYELKDDDSYCLVVQKTGETWECHNLEKKEKLLNNIDKEYLVWKDDSGKDIYIKMTIDWNFLTGIPEISTDADDENPQP